MKHDETSLR